MRTLDDLRGAFALLERQADEYTVQRSAEFDETAEEIPIVDGAERHKPRRPILWLSAATVAAALAVGGVVLFGQGGGHAPAGGSSNLPATGVPVPLTVDQLALPFTIDPSVGVRVFQYGTGGGEFNANLADSSHIYMFVLFPAGVSSNQLDKSRPVQINGAQGEIAESTVQSAEASVSASATAASGSGSAPVPQTSVSPSQQSAQLAWSTPSGRAALLQGLGTPVSEDQLLAVARAIHFTSVQTAETVMHTAFSLNAAPAGMQLFSVGSWWPVPGMPQQIKVTNTDFETDIAYRQTGGTNVGPSETNVGPVVQISVMSADPGENHGPHVQSVSVDGKPGYWNDQLDELVLHESSAAYVVVSATNVAVRALTENEALAIAKTVTVAKNPKDTSTWFNAATAIPVR